MAVAVSDVLPKGSTEWRAAAAMLVGGFIGSVIHPATWLTGGPLRWMSLLMAMASQESGFNPEASGDGGRSIGILQFYDTTWAYLGMGDRSRTSGFWSGYAAAAYVQSALASDWRWLIIGVPFIGPTYARILWRYGSDAFAVAQVMEAMGVVEQEGRFATAWQVFRLPTVVLGLIIAALVYRRFK